MEAAVVQARIHNKKRIAVVHKANIIKPYNFFLDAMEKFQQLNSDLEFKPYIVDDYCMKVVEDPTIFDVVVAPNMFGDIISDLHAGMIGGLGVAPSANIGRKHAMFEAVHGTWPSAAGKGLANPSALLLASTMLLRHIDDYETADKIEKAMHYVYANRRKECTSEKLIGGEGTTTSFTKAIIASL
jgi:isocitrate dehydrogenase (NAD+)